MELNKKANYATWLVYTELFKNKEYDRKIESKDLKLEALDLLKQTIHNVSPFYKFGRCFLHEVQWQYIKEIINQKRIVRENYL